MNKIFLIGNLTRDPERSQFSDDLVNCRMTVAVTRNYGKKDSYGKKETDFFRVVCWRGLAENCCKFLKKGSQVGVFGSISIRKYKTSDGVSRESIEVSADEVQFLTRRYETDSSDAGLSEDSMPKSDRSDEGLEEIDDDDMPF